MHSVIGLFDYYNHIEWALGVLENYDIDSEQISIMACDSNTVKPAKAAISTVASGPNSRGVIGFLQGPGTFNFVLPGIGHMIATGTLAGVLFTTLDTTDYPLLAGSGLLGALIGLGFSKEEAEFYTDGVKEGGILVSVETELQNEYRICAILRGAGAMDVTSCHRS